MKIIYLVPGSGGSFYCQNCVRDLALVKALRAQGDDALSIPLYLPLTANQGPTGNQAPVFYGAVQLYLTHSFPWLRQLPRVLLRVFDAPWLLNWASRQAGSTNANELEELTLSMLRGEHGKQAQELEDLAAWLEQEGKPEVLHLSNALLVGLAHKIKQRLQIPIVCTLQDEDQWIDAMSPSAAKSAWELISERASDVDVFLAVSEYYGGLMQNRLGLSKDHLKVVPLGVELDGFEASPLPFDPPVVGYLSRACESLGFDQLVDAFIQLRTLPELRQLRLRVTGGRTAADEPFLKKVRAKLERNHAADAVEFVDQFELPQRQAFLKSLTVMSVPVPKGEAFGAFQIEALAAGVPLVQPRAGAFPEILTRTGGGVLYDPNHPQALFEALRQLLLDPPRVKALGAHGRRVVQEQYGISHMAANTRKVYREVISRRTSLSATQG